MMCDDNIATDCRQSFSIIIAQKLLTAPTAVATDKKPAKTKTKSNTSDSLHSAHIPSADEGWTLAKVDEFPLGAIHVSILSLLERTKHSVMQSHSVVALQLKKLEEVGVVESQELTKADVSGQEVGAGEIGRPIASVDVEVSLHTITNMAQTIIQ